MNTEYPETLKGRPQIKAMGVAPSFCDFCALLRPIPSGIDTTSARG